MSEVLRNTTEAEADYISHQGPIYPTPPYPFITLPDPEHSHNTSLLVVYMYAIIGNLTPCHKNLAERSLISDIAQLIPLKMK